jgi:hypothetical protein
LPLEIVRADGLAKPDVGLGDQNVHGLQVCNRLRRGRLVIVRPARKIGGNAARTESDDQDDYTRYIHTLTSYFYAGILELDGGSSFPCSDD